MKKAYIIPEIQIYEADAENLLVGTNLKQRADVDGSGTPDFDGDEGNSDGSGSCAKPGDFFCDNFEYDFDF